MPVHSAVRKRLSGGEATHDGVYNPQCFSRHGMGARTAPVQCIVARQRDPTSCAPGWKVRSPVVLRTPADGESAKSVVSCT